MRINEVKLTKKRQKDIQDWEDHRLPLHVKHKPEIHELKSDLITVV